MDYLESAGRYLEQREDRDKIVFAVLQGGVIRKGLISSDGALVDMDLAIAYRTRNDHIRKAAISKNNDDFGEMFEGILVDYRPFYLDEIKEPQEWKERIRYIWDRETVFACGDREMYDRFRSQVRMSDLEQKEIIINCMIHIQMKGIWPESRNLFEGLSIDKTKERKTYWEDKGCPLYGRVMKMRAFEYIEELIFALNKCFMPSPKYREYILQKSLEWVPDSYEKMLRDYTSGSAGMEDSMNAAVSECLKRIQELGIETENPYKYRFVSKVYSIVHENMF